MTPQRSIRQLGMAGQPYPSRHLDPATQLHPHPAHSTQRIGCAGWTQVHFQFVTFDLVNLMEAALDQTTGRKSRRSYKGVKEQIQAHCLRRHLATNAGDDMSEGQKGCAGRDA